MIEEQSAGYCRAEGQVEADNGGYSGPGYVNTNNELGAGIEWSVQASSAGMYEAIFVYASPDPTRPAQLSVDGVSSTELLPFDSSGDWTTWVSSTAQLPLHEGENLIRLEATTAAGLPNIDSLELKGAALSAGSCPQDPPPNEALTIWIAGDSTVANGSTPCPRGWGRSFSEHFNDQVTVENLAAGGRSVRTWLYEVTTQMGSDGECVLNTDGSGQPILQARWTDMLTRMEEGDYLFIQFGINDGSSTCDRHVGPAQFKKEYAYMAEEARARGVEPVFLTPISAIKCSGSTAVASRGFLTETKAVASELNVPLIDLHQLSIDLYNERGFCPVPGGDVSASTTGPVGDFFCDDHTHFSEQGSQVIAQVVADAVDALGLSLSNYLK